MDSFKVSLRWCCVLFLVALVSRAQGASWIRINQMGYLPHSIKVAVFISDQTADIQTFQLIDAQSGQMVFQGFPMAYPGAKWGMQSAARLPFSKFTRTGKYYLKVGDAQSPEFIIDSDRYQGSADFILNYMRQQRCGFNPYLKDSCHTHDGFIVDHPSKSGQIIDVTGGWHDASDYLQYVATSANAVYQMLFAYSQNPVIYGDHYLASGLPGRDGLPDILNEIRWGLEWLMKMNPDSGVMYYQIADDRDHHQFRLPNTDSVSYGKGLYRPVYYVTGKVPNVSKYTNRTTGVSSVAGKFSAAFALGARMFKSLDPMFSGQLVMRAKTAYSFGVSDLGVTQTASVVSPYFYEEDNYVDDLELAAIELYQLTGAEYYKKQANYWGQLEPVTPWMQWGSARHYQYYPFVNMGHANQLMLNVPEAQTYLGFMKLGLKAIYERGASDPFFNGIPYIWCSNNLNVAALTQARLYFKACGDSTYLEMEAALRDWLFGCNPWGTSMICGLPTSGDSPMYPHSAITLIKKEPTFGGLVDGPVYREIFDKLRGVQLYRPDDYYSFQNGVAIYHDDIGDYSSNEPTMDGTASLSFYLCSLEKEGLQEKMMANCVSDVSDALVRMNTDQKTIYLIFSADQYGDGADFVLNSLDRNRCKASFFLTGNFLRNPQFAGVVKRIISDHHYLGPHSDQHPLYASWENRDSLLITRQQFDDDLNANLKVLTNLGVESKKIKYFLSPYEYCSRTNTQWAFEHKIQMINFTPGIGTNADYTTPEMGNYKSSKQLMDRLMNYEKSDSNGLNGAVLLIHLGTHPDRKDKFYDQLDRLIDQLKKKGYSFRALN